MFKNKKITFFFLQIILCFSLNAQIIKNKSFFNINVIPFSEISYGTMKEILFFSNSDEKTSLLEWKKKGLFYFGSDFEFSYKNSIFTIGACFAYPINFGKMLDSDWNEDGIKTMYSISEIKVNNSFFSNLIYKYKIDFGRNIIFPIFEIDYAFNDFLSKNAEGWYASKDFSTDGKDHSWNSEYAHHYPDEKYKLLGVEYQNHLISTFLGFEYLTKCTKKVDFGFKFYFSPYTYSYSKDHHLGRKNDWEIIYSQGHFIFKYFKTEIFTNYKLNNFLSLKFIFYGKYLAPVKGDLFDKDMYLDSQKIAHAEWNINFRLALNIFLF